MVAINGFALRLQFVQSTNEITISFRNRSETTYNSWTTANLFTVRDALSLYWVWLHVCVMYECSFLYSLQLFWVQIAAACEFVGTLNNRNAYNRYGNGNSQCLVLQTLVLHKNSLEKRSTRIEHAEKQMRSYFENGI